MSAKTAALPPAPDRRWPTWARVLLGAGIGCASLCVLMLVLCVVGVWWAITPGPQEAPPAFVDDDTLGMIRVPSPGEDEGVNALMMELISEFHRATWERIPEDKAPPLFGLMRQMQRRQIESGRAARKLATSMPRDVAVLLVRRPGDDPTWMAVVNLARAPRIYRFALTWVARRAPDVEAIPHRGETIIVFEDLPALCFVDSTLLVAQDVEILKRAIDRSREPAGGDSTVARRMAAVPDDWDAFGVLDNRTGELSAALRNVALLLEQLPGEGFPVDLGDRELEIAEPDGWEAVTDVELGIDLVDVSTMRVELDVIFEDEEAASISVLRLERLLAAVVAEPAGSSDLRASWEIDRAGSSVSVALTFEGIDRAISGGLEALLDETHGARKELGPIPE